MIPALNEEHGIGETVAAIDEVIPPSIAHEVIVADHGSTDRTAEVARQHGARVEIFTGGTIASLRNRAAAAARGDVLIFLDADVHVTSAWGQRLPAVLEVMDEDHQLVTGSVCKISRNPTWLEKAWFQPRKRSSHIGSGHLLIHSRKFEELRGFDPSFETGEDYDLCRRVVQGGGRLVSDAQLLVHHEGFPKTVRSFVRREAWHGRSDYTSFTAVLRSRVAVASLLFLGAHIAGVAALIWGAQLVLVLAVVSICLLCTAASLYTFGWGGVGRLVTTSALYYVYFWGRVAAMAETGGRVR